MATANTGKKPTPQTRVVIKDDTLRRNAVTVITPELRMQAAMAGRPIPDSVTFVPTKDYKGRQVQEIVTSEHVYEGSHLVHAVRRAKRFMRNQWAAGASAPRHILLAMAAFQEADPAGFEETARAALA